MGRFARKIRRAAHCPKVKVKRRKSRRASLLETWKRLALAKESRKPK